MSSRLSGPPPHTQGARSPAVAPASEPTRLTRGTWLRRVSVPISSPVAGEPTAPSCGGPAFRRFRPALRLRLRFFGCFAHGFILASGGVYWGWWPDAATSHGEGATPLGVTPGPASPSGLPLPTPAGNGRLCAAGTPGFMSVLRPGRPTPWCRCRPDAPRARRGGVLARTPDGKGWDTGVRKSLPTRPRVATRAQGVAARTAVVRIVRVACAARRAPFRAHNELRKHHF